MNLATLLNQKSAPIPPGIGRLVTQKIPEDDVLDKYATRSRKCAQCGAMDDGTNFYRLGNRCKKCQKVNRCLDK